MVGWLLKLCCFEYVVCRARKTLFYTTLLHYTKIYKTKKRMIIEKRIGNNNKINEFQKQII